MSDSGNDGCSLPPEIIADVLSRLPVKSLCRFKCVSPSWYYLISSPYFAQTHLNRTNTNNPKHLDRNIIISSSSHDLYSVNLTADVPPIATKIDFPLLQRSEDKSVEVLNSCNGLVLVSDEGNSHLFLLNPSTRDCKKLPPLPFVLNPVCGFYEFAYGLGYDSSEDDYKVVMLSCSNIEFGSESESSTLSDITIVAVYSLKTNAWRRIKDTHYSLDRTSSGVYCNGCLHWLCWWNGSYLMVAFDWADEIFREVPLPGEIFSEVQLLGLFDDYVIVNLEVVIVGYCLCLACKRASDPVEVWMMKEYGVRASWTKNLIDTHDMYLQGLLTEDEFLLMGDVVQGQNEDKLVVYNPKKGTLSDIVVRGFPTTFFSWSTYVETLVSPNQCNDGGGIGKQGYS